MANPLIGVSMEGTTGSLVEVNISSLQSEEQHYVSYNVQDKRSSIGLQGTEELDSGGPRLYRYEYEDDNDIILDEDFLMTLDVEDDGQDFLSSNHGQHPPHDLNEEFYQRPPIIEVSSISSYSLHSHERQHAGCSAYHDSSGDELKENVLNKSHQQLSYVSQRNTLFKPVIPVITEDSGEERSSPLGDIVPDTKQRGVSKFDNPIRINYTRLHKGTMDNTTPKRRSSFSISEMSSDEEEEDSISSGEDEERMKQYRKVSCTPKVLQAAKGITTRRHSIATSSVDHLEQILSLLKKRNLIEEEEVAGNAGSVSSNIGLSSSLTNRVEGKTLEWLKESDFSKNDQSDDKKAKYQNDLHRADGLHTDGGRMIKSIARQRPTRRFSIDVSNLSNIEYTTAVEDPLFAREILHQKIINLASSQDNIDEHDENDVSSSQKADNDISIQRTRRLSVGNGPPPGFQPKMITKRKSEPKMSTAFASPRQSAFRDFQTGRDGAIVCDDGAEPVLAKQPSRVRQRRSSWACIGAHPALQMISRVTLLKESNYDDDAETAERPEVKDPYRLTLHFISDPKQSKKLKCLLRPLTHSVAPKLKLFNYVDRSERVVFDNKEPDVMAIPSLAIMVFLQEEQGIERILNARQYLKEAPWQLHHKDLVGGNVVPYPTNNQDFYSHADGMPLWAVRQILGKDRLRFMIFVSYENWDDTVSLYSKILSRDVQFQKEDFCYFLVFCCRKLNLEVQLALKRLPVGFVPTPLDAAILQFKVQDIGQLVPLLPRVCSPISAKRWQTTDLDGNKLLLLVQRESGNHDSGNGGGRHRENDGEIYQFSGKSSPNSEGETSASEGNNTFKDISNYV